jgi:hypothetical protein
MDFSKTFKAIWWAILILGIGYYLGSRLEQLQAGKPTWFDALAFTVWVALGLGPFFKEMEFLGFKLKQEVKQLKEHVTAEVASLRDIVQHQEQRQSVTSNVFAYPPPTDAQLPDIREQVRLAVRDAVGPQPAAQIPAAALVGEALTDDVQFLTSSRIIIERELRSIYQAQSFPTHSVSPKRYEPVTRIADSLVRQEAISPDLAHAIREVYAVCSMAMHGEEVSPAKVEFVRNAAPELIAALRSLSSRYA